MCQNNKMVNKLIQINRIFEIMKHHGKEIILCLSIIFLNKTRAKTSNLCGYICQREREIQRQRYIEVEQLLHNIILKIYIHVLKNFTGCLYNPVYK